MARNLGCFILGGFGLFVLTVASISPELEAYMDAKYDALAECEDNHKGVFAEINKTYFTCYRPVGSGRVVLANYKVLGGKQGRYKAIRY